MFDNDLGELIGVVCEGVVYGEFSDCIIDAPLSLTCARSSRHLHRAVPSFLGVPLWRTSDADQQADGHLHVAPFRALYTSFLSRVQPLLQNVGTLGYCSHDRYILTCPGTIRKVQE